MAHAPVALDGGDVYATFADGSPALIGHPVELGSTLYCNFSAHLEWTPENRRLVDVLVGLTGLERSFQVFRGNGKSGGFQSFRYTRGPLEMIGLHHTLSSQLRPGAQLTLRTRSTAHTYEVLSGTQYGQRDEISFRAPPRGQPILFARLPYAVEKVTLVCAEAARPGDVVPYRVSVHAAGEAVGDHVLRVEVTDPEGHAAEPLSRNVTAVNGQYPGALPFAFNAPRGAWTLRVRDVISGKTAARTVSLR